MWKIYPYVTHLLNWQRSTDVTPCGQTHCHIFHQNAKNVHIATDCTRSPCDQKVLMHIRLLYSRSFGMGYRRYRIAIWQADGIATLVDLGSISKSDNRVFQGLMVSAIDGLGGSMWCQMRVDTANKQMSIVCFEGLPNIVTSRGCSVGLINYYMFFFWTHRKNIEATLQKVGICWAFYTWLI